MGEDRHVARNLQIEEHLIYPRRRDVVRRLDEDVARVGQRQHASVTELRNAVRCNVIVCPRNELQRNVRLVESSLQLADGGANPAIRVLIETGQNVRRACDHGDAVGDERARHIQCCVHIGRAVVDAREDVAVQVDHRLGPALLGARKLGSSRPERTRPAGRRASPASPSFSAKGKGNAT